MEKNWQKACRFSVWLQRQIEHQRLQMDLLEDWCSRRIGLEEFQTFAAWQNLIENEDEAELARQLRILRRHVVSQIMVRDLCRQSDLAEVTETITLFADFAVNIAADFAYRYFVGMYGVPMGRYTQTPQFLSVVAMGKAGGYELNVSSDIDLIFVYQESGDTNGKRERSNQEFFTKVGQKLIALLDNLTEEGQVFRVDMRLRPDGDSGALVLSETALEQYLVAHGREWERYAWCKGRVVTPHANDLKALVRPFVFRKYLDFSAYEALRNLHQQIRSEVAKKSMADNIKLGAGGIREVEFIAQVFQMIRGGQNRALQLKGTQETLRKLAELKILSDETVEKLLKAYRFLRDVEHRLQYWDDQQTQRLPENPEQQQLLAQSMGFEKPSDFQAALAQHRSFVNQTFNDILGESEEKESQEDNPYAAVWHSKDCETAAEILGQLGWQNAQTVAQRLFTMKNSSRYRHLPIQAQTRLDVVLPQFIQAAQQSHQAETTLARSLDFLENISRRSAYLAFLQQYPQALNQLVQLMAQSAWLADYLQRHPILLDELLSAQLMEPINWTQAKQELMARLQASEDAEGKMDALRHFQHAQIFRLAVQDLAGQWTVEALSDELSQLADLILEQALHHAWQEMPKKHCEQAQFAVIAYGKLGGKELAYTSDLDLVYLFDDPHPDAADHYGKLARRLNTWLSSNTGAGMLYDLDLRLRPNGNAGFLAYSVSAFEKYQRENAWTWEHQALSRARFICGSPEIGQKFEQIRRAILTQSRNHDELKQEIITMREKMFGTHPPKDSDVKYARGGIVDVEFVVQYLILAHSHQAKELLENYGNLALLQMAADRNLIEANIAEQCQKAYRFYRKVQHNKKLREWQQMQVDEVLLRHYESVRALWTQVFGEAPKH